jgi:hypothetical protein
MKQKSNENKNVTQHSVICIKAKNEADLAL